MNGDARDGARPLDDLGLARKRPFNVRHERRAKVRKAAFGTSARWRDACDECMMHSGSRSIRRAACSANHSYDMAGCSPTGRQHAEFGDCPLFKATEKGRGDMLKVYGFSKVNAVARGNTRDLRVLWGLEEMQLPFELVGMDHPAHDLNSDAYRRLSPFEQIPAIDDEGLLLSESAAILIYLAKKSGKLIASDPTGEAQVVRWCFAAMNSIEMPLMSILLIDWAKDEGSGKARAGMVGWANRLLTGLERWLDGREYVATDSFTVADILMAHVLAGIKDDSLIKPYARIAGYRDRCLARPAWKRTIDSYYARVQAA